MILPNKHTADWESIRQQKKIQIYKDTIREDDNIVYYDYEVRDKFILNNKTAFKYETLYIGPF